MQALISGQAGVAILIRPEGLVAFRVESSRIGIPQLPSGSHISWWGATDVAHLESVTKESALEHLRVAEDCDTAMHLALILRPPRRPRDSHGCCGITWGAFRRE